MASGEKAIRSSGIDRREIGALVHGSVCRDYLEPATASGVHHRLDLPAECMVYDVSNACLGLLNGMVQVANMIELGQIRAGLVIGTESSRALVETTIQRLNSDTSLTRKDIKLAVASLTIGSGSAAILLTDRELSRTGNRLLGGVVRTATDHCQLCQSGRDESGGDDMKPLMWTDSERLMHEGVAAAKEAFNDFLAELNWDASDVDKTFCHQVGRAHQKLLFESLGLDVSLDYPTISQLGNTGSVAPSHGRRHGNRKRPSPTKRSRGHARNRFRHQRPHARSRLANQPIGPEHSRSPRPLTDCHCRAVSRSRAPRDPEAAYQAAIRKPDNTTGTPDYSWVARPERSDGRGGWTVHAHRLRSGRATPCTTLPRSPTAPPTWRSR